MFASAGESTPVVWDVLLRDGSTLRLQAPTPADFDDVMGFFDGMSAESRLMRFHGYVRTDAAARAAVEAGGPDRFSLIARHDGHVVAVAGFDGLREMRAAEVAFAVADDFQRRGAATRMLEQLAEIAARRGRVAGSITAPGSHGPRRDSLPSPGSSHRPSVVADQAPVSEQAGLAS